MAKPKFKDLVYFNTQAKTYGSAIKLDKAYLRCLVFIIAALPLATSWMFFLIPKIKDIIIRY